MKKYILTLAIIAGVYIYSYGQNIPNGNFASWAMLHGTLQPVGWLSNNHTLWVTITQYSPGYDNSNYAAQLSVVNYYGYYYIGFITQKFAYNQSPVSLTGAYEILPQTGDSVYIEVIAILFNNKSPVATSNFVQGSKVSTSFIPFTVNFDYISQNTPDTAYVYVTMVSKKTMSNSAVVIDNLAFSNEGATGIANMNEVIGIGNIYPLPAKNYILIPVNIVKPVNLNIIIYDLAGNEIKDYFKNLYGSSNVEIDVNDIASGAYLISLENGYFRTVRKLIITR